jgi:hypothetical protein
MYSIIYTCKDPLTYDILYDEFLAFRIIKEGDRTLFYYKTTNEYMPIECMYEFIYKTIPNIPLILKTHTLLKDDIYETKQVLDINIKHIINIFREN